MSRSAAVAIAVAVIALLPASALAVEKHQFRQQFGPVQGTRHSINGSSGFNVDQWDALVIDLDITTEPDGVTNPLYEGQTHTVSNPIYQGGNRAGELFASDVISLSITFGSITHLHAEGIIHRDIATRNVLLSTSQGDFSVDLVAEGIDWIFSSDAPADATVGPIRWMAPESLRLYMGGDTQSTDYIDIDPFFYFDSTPVPAPATAPLLALGALIVRRRR